jgi:hypothetical protein
VAERAEFDAVAVQKKAERKSAALRHLGPEEGTGTTVWARAAQDELARHEEARQLLSAGGAGVETWEITPGGEHVSARWRHAEPPRDIQRSH